VPSCRLNSSVRPMFGALVTLGGLCGMISGIVLAFTVPASRSEIALADPKYADRLFLSGAGAFWFQVPLRFVVLFSEPVPNNAKTAVWPLKVLGVVYFSSIAIFAAGILGAAMS
jgi:hypothetical protein